MLMSFGGGTELSKLYRGTVVVGRATVVDGAGGGGLAFVAPPLLHAAKPNREIESSWRPHLATLEHVRRRRAPSQWLVDTLPPVKAFRRVLVVLGVAGLIGAFAKLRGKGGVPPTSGGWRELEGPDFR
jgi:hypothetical protein